MLNLLANVIADTFTKECGKFQMRKEAPKAFRMAFSLPNETGEEGYRHLEVILFAPLNYVQVWIRETWDVISEDDLEYDEDGDSRIKKGKDYTKGADPWKLVSDHDSGWRSGVESTLREYDHKLLTFSGPGWYQLVDANKVECLNDSTSSAS